MNETLETIRKRRTIRKFTAEDVTDEQLETLLLAGFYAPNRLDLRPLHYVVIREAGLKEKLANALRVRPYIQQAPVVIAVVGDPNISPTWPLDGAAAMENMAIAATAMGLGAAWVGGPGNTMWDSAVQVLRESASLPPQMEAVGLLCVGHPDEAKPAHTKDAKYDGSRVHLDHWNNLRP
ncbi:MAG: nitroreductase family protein [Chloroflexi bacterium]|nr:nitroreductase family protein [Chloroflexota bacterium]